MAGVVVLGRRPGVSMGTQASRLRGGPGQDRHARVRLPPVPPPVLQPVGVGQDGAALIHRELDDLAEGKVGPPWPRPSRSCAATVWPGTNWEGERARPACRGASGPLPGTAAGSHLVIGSVPPVGRRATVLAPGGQGGEVQVVEQVGRLFTVTTKESERGWHYTYCGRGKKLMLCAGANSPGGL